MKIVAEALAVENLAPKVRSQLRQELEQIMRGIQENYGVGFAVFFES